MANAPNTYGVQPVPAQVSITGTLNGLFKEVYAKELVNLIPDGVKLLTKIPFSKRDAALGSFYHQPVILGHEHGVTFAAGDDDAFNLNDAVAGQIKDAQVQGTQLVLRSMLGLAAASRSMNGGASAFMQATKFLVGNMLRSVTKKLEIEMLYGQVGYADIGALAATNQFVIPDAQWAPGIWAGSEKMPIDFVIANAVVASASVTAVDFATKTVTFSGAPLTIGASTVYHGGALGKEFAGIHKILTNTGTLFGINASAYSLFKGNEYDAGNGGPAQNLSYTKIQEAIAKAVEKGLDNDVIVLVNPKVWADVLTDVAATRALDQVQVPYSTAVQERGSKEIKFHGQNGMIEIVPSIYCKQGFAYVISPDDYMRIGSTDVTFNRPGKDGEFFKDMEDKAGYELRCYTDQALFSSAPAKGCLIWNIV